MLTVEEAVKAAKAGATQLVMQHSGVAVKCAKKGDTYTFTPSFPKDSPALSERVFTSNYYGKMFDVPKGKPGPVEK